MVKKESWKNQGFLRGHEQVTFGGHEHLSRVFLRLMSIEQGTFGDHEQGTF